jgi:hypothetical protein
MRLHGRLWLPSLCGAAALACGAPGETTSSQTSAALIGSGSDPGGPIGHPNVPVVDSGLCDERAADPVCGATGTKYVNACFAARAGDTAWGPCTTCVANPSCSSSPTNTPGVFDPLYFPEDPTFAQALAAAECGPETYYESGKGPGGPYWATAICLSSFTESAADLAADTSGILPCDRCTGDPPVGRVVVAWMRSGDGPDGKPGAGCSSFQCLVAAQE